MGTLRRHRRFRTAVVIAGALACAGLLTSCGLVDRGASPESEDAAATLNKAYGLDLSAEDFDGLNSGLGADVTIGGKKYDVTICKISKSARNDDTVVVQGDLVLCTSDDGKYVPPAAD